MGYKCTKCKTALESIKYDTSDDDGWEAKRIILKKYPCTKCGKHSSYEGGEAYVLWD